MAVHSISVKELISRVRLVFPSAPETYILNLINDALVEIGTYKTKVATAKINLESGKMYYDLADGATDASGNEMEVNNVLRVYALDNEGDYIVIPRLIEKDLLLADIANEDKLNTPN
tara:strand:+ start:167 stop:517 length:351 start_codon:yes stop_codon:yes gene_type:complete